MSSRTSPAGSALLAGARRWPTLLGAALAVQSLVDSSGGLEFTAVLFIAAAGYQALALLDRPRWTWPAVVVLFAAVIGLRALRIDVVAVMVVAVLVLAVAVLVTRLHGLRMLQVPVALALAGTGVLAFQVPPDIATVVVAVGLIAHAAWDVVLWRADAVVARTFTEWCAVYDVVLGVGLLVALAL